MQKRNFNFIIFFLIFLTIFAIKITKTSAEDEKITKNIIKDVTNEEFKNSLLQWRNKLNKLNNNQTNNQTNTQKKTLDENNCNVHVLLGSLPLTGHLNPLIGIAQELARRGCRVSFPVIHSKTKSLEFYTLNPLLNENFQILSMPGDVDGIPLSKRAGISEKSIFEFFTSIRGIIPGFMNMTKDYEVPLRHLFDDPLTRPDLVVSSPMIFQILLFAEQYEVPIVTVKPGLIMEKEINYNHVPNSMSGFRKEMIWYERLLNAIFFPIFNQLLPMIIYSPAIEYRQNFLSKKTSDLDLYNRNLKKLNESKNEFKSRFEVTHIQQTCFGLEYPQPLSPRFELVGPIFPLFDEPLNGNFSIDGNNENILQFLERNEKEGVIYVALGTQAVINHLLALRLLKGLGETKKPILWSLPLDQRNFLPKNYTKYIKDLFLVPFIQQRSLLQHPSIKIFLSHTGASSGHESLYFGVPIVCLPFFGDQYDVCNRVVESGSGLQIDKVKSNSDEISFALLSVLSNPSYKENAMRIGKIFRSCGGVKRALEVMQRELDVGSSHLKLIHKEFNWFYQFEWDIFFAEILISLIIPYFCYRFICFTLRKIFSFCYPRQSTKQKIH